MILLFGTKQNLNETKPTYIQEPKSKSKSKPEPNRVVVEPTRLKIPGHATGYLL